MITREADYAIRAVLFLAALPKKQDVVSTAALAESTQIPYRFLRRILGTLTKAKIIRSCRGKSGGVGLAQAAGAITLFDVINAVDARCTKLNGCLMGYEICRRQGKCAVHDVLQRVQENLEADLQRVTFAQLCKEEKKY